MKKRIASLLLAALLLAAFFAGCSTRETAAETPAPAETAAAAPAATAKPASTPAATEAPAATPKPTAAPELLYENPFNGEKIAEPWTARPFTVMLNNLEPALPQRGVGAADILYEVLVEGGITRMLGVFSDIQSAEQFGTIRSIRPYYIDLAKSYGAVIVHSGGSDNAYSRLWAEDNIDGTRGQYSFDVFYRDRTRIPRGIEHSQFAYGADLYRCAKELGYPLTVGEDYDSGLRFTADGTPSGGDAADRIEVSFGYYKTTSFAYDKDSGLYSTREYGSDYIDEITGGVVTFRNVLAIYAEIYYEDNEGRLAISLNNRSGDGYFACGGKYVPITWKKGGDGEPFRYYLSDGSELALGAGHTYISILSRGFGGSVDFS